MQSRCYIHPQFHHELNHTIDHQCDPQWREDLLRCVPLLIDLMMQTHDQPPEQFEHAVRAIVRDHCQIDEAGDAACHDDAALEPSVQAILTRLTAQRESQLAHTATELPPQMFG